MFGVVPSRCPPLFIGRDFLIIAALVVGMGHNALRVRACTKKLVVSQAGHLLLPLKPHVWHSEINIITLSVSDVPPLLRQRRRFQHLRVKKYLSHPRGLGAPDASINWESPKGSPCAGEEHREGLEKNQRNAVSQPSTFSSLKPTIRNVAAAQDSSQLRLFRFKRQEEETLVDYHARTCTTARKTRVQMGIACSV